MKKLITLVLAVSMLCGCGAEQAVSEPSEPETETIAEQSTKKESTTEYSPDEYPLYDFSDIDKVCKDQEKALGTKLSFYGEVKDITKIGNEFLYDFNVYSDSDDNYSKGKMSFYVNSFCHIKGIPLGSYGLTTAKIQNFRDGKPVFYVYDYDFEYQSGIFWGDSLPAKPTNIKSTTAPTTTTEAVKTTTEPPTDPPTEPEPTEPPAPTLSKEDKYKEKCEVIDYKSIARDQDGLSGKDVKITGKITQVIGNDTFMVATGQTSYGSYFGDTMLVYYSIGDGDRLLEDDIVTFYGMLTGLYTYETVLGAEKTVPSMLGMYAELN